MKEKMDQLLHTMLKNDASDLHFTKENQQLKIQIRTPEGIHDVFQNALDLALFYYLKYIANLDLANTSTPQSGNFTYQFQKQCYYFRFSTIATLNKETAVLRILNNHGDISMEALSQKKSVYESFCGWTKSRSGLVVLSGPTGSGKTTTLHAILSRIANEHRLKVVSLEDPIEIFDSTYLQLQVNEHNHFTYEEGIRELMRHDPDVIMIGEVRDPKAAKMLLRSALSGHMIFTTIHAKSCQETIQRLMEFGLSLSDLKHTLSAVCSQRLYAGKKKGERVCIYEILEKENLQYYLEKQQLPTSHKDIFKEIQDAVKHKAISLEEAQYDL